MEVEFEVNDPGSPAAESDEVELSGAAPTVIFVPVATAPLTAVTAKAGEAVSNGIIRVNA